MIIKGNRSGKQPPQGTGLSSTQSAESLWSEEKIEAGEIQERRRSDRRRGYRRVEDKNVISKAHDEANAIRENAYQEGFDQGLMEAQGTVEELQGVIQRLLKAREEALSSSADEIASIAVQVAERIIRTEVACDPSLVLGLVKDTIQKAGRNNKTILVKVHPDDIPLVKQGLRDDPIPNLDAELIVMEEPTVDPGSCIVETNSGLVDATFSTQLHVLRQLFGEMS